MGRGVSRGTWFVLAAVLVAPACTADREPAPRVAAATDRPVATAGAPATPAAEPAAAPAAPAPLPAAAPTRDVVEQPWLPFATVGGITLHHPSARVERVGFHESNHEGAQPMLPLPSAVAASVLESRERGTAPTTAADIVAEPGVEIRSPVTGTVKRAGTYVLYCKHSDDYLVIAPDSNPAWEVKLLHIDGVRVRRGQRLEAGETVVAGGPTQLPFESQVDETSAVQPPWPHVHLEVVDPSIPNKPSPGGGCP